MQAGYPEDVRLKKIAARAAVMAQAGQYNFMRCVRRGEYGAAALALTEFAQAAVSMAHLLCSRYAPYYKWGFRSLRSLEEIAADIVSVLRARGLTSGNWDYLEPHALEITERIKDPVLRTLHIMEG